MSRAENEHWEDEAEALRWLLTSHQRRMLTAETLQHWEDERNEDE